MEQERKIAASTDYSRFDNATIGEGTLIEPDVTLGYVYHKDAGSTHIGEHCTLRKGTIIYGDVTIGDYFQTGHYVVIRAKVQIGNYCTMLNHSTIEGIVRMGNGVRIMTNVYIPSRTWFGDNIFVGPGVIFLNDRYPGRLEVMPTPRGATIEDEVMIGGGCVILPGVTIGERSFIAAGAVVNKDVPPRSLVMGVPGRIEPLPEKLDMINNRQLTIQPLDLWNPRSQNINAATWPPDWKMEK